MAPGKLRSHFDSFFLLKERHACPPQPWRAASVSEALTPSLCGSAAGFVRVGLGGVLHQVMMGLHCVATLPVCPVELGNARRCHPSVMRRGERRTAPFLIPNAPLEGMGGLPGILAPPVIRSRLPVVLGQAGGAAGSRFAGL